MERQKGTLKCWFDSDKLTDPRVIEMDTLGFLAWDKTKDGPYNGMRFTLEPVARLRYLLAKVGLKDTKITLDKEGSDYLNSGTNAFWLTLERELALRLFSEKGDKALRDIYEKAKPGFYTTEFEAAKDQAAARKALCDDLQKRSLAALNAPPPAIDRKKETPPSFDFSPRPIH